MQSVKKMAPRSALPWEKLLALRLVLLSVRHWAPRWEWQTVPQMGPQ
jgi:hypothetical protein